MADEPEIILDVAAEETVALNPEQKHQLDALDSGFTWYVYGQKPHENFGDRSWSIAGNDMQVLTVTLPAQDRMISEVGSFMFGSSGIEIDVELTLANGSEGIQRICGGESCVKLLLVNNSSQPGYVGMTPNFPAKVIPVQFGKHVDSSHALIAQGGAYMTHLGEVDVACDQDLNPKTVCCAGFGCCRQKITGDDNSLVFLAAGGTLVYKKLEEGETVTVDSRSVVAIEESVHLDIVSNGRFCTCCCGGEGCFSTTLTGPGKVFMQSMNFKKFQEAVQVTVIDDRGSSKAKPNIANPLGDVQW